MYCGYRFAFGPNVKPQKPALQQRLITGNLSGIAELHWAPPLGKATVACTAMGGDTTVQLLGLRYADRLVWVRADKDVNKCSEAGNGEFVARPYLGGLLDEAGRQGRWPGLGSQNGCDIMPFGRFGQQNSMAPGGVSAIDVCTTGNSETVLSGTITDPDAIKQVTHLLNQQATAPSTPSCMPIKGAEQTDVTLGLRYPDGPRVTVRVNTGCDPGLNNDSVQASAPAELAPLLKRLTAGS